MKPGAEQERFVLMKPHIKGSYDIVQSDQPLSEELGIPVSFNPMGEITVILHFHGGSFLWGTGRQSDCGATASRILKRISRAALFVQYRLASDPTCHLPAAVQDAVTAYKHRLDMKIPAFNIVISSDSAGGNVTIALLRHISSLEGNSLPSPLAALLWSLSVDLAAQRNPDSIDLHRNNRSDYITGLTPVWSVNAYAPKTMDPSDPWFSPLQDPFSTQVPLWIMVGGAEVLYDIIVGFAGRKRGVKGNMITVYGGTQCTSRYRLRRTYFRLGQRNRCWSAGCG